MGLETAALAAVAVSAVGTGVAFYGQQQQAKAAEATARYNQQIAKQQAEALRAQAAQESEVTAENMRRKQAENARIIGLQREAIAASGLTPTGTPLAVLGETVMRLERDLMDLSFAANNRVRSYYAGAANAENQGRLAYSQGMAEGSAMRTASYAGLLQGAASAATGYGDARGFLS